MLETALGLARRGFLVFPIKPGEKKPPLIHAWQEHATSDEAQIRSWWTQWPQANVGIHCDGLLVIDVDPKKGGYESLETLQAENSLEATYEVETPSGGRHIYYRLPSGATVRNGVDVLGPGVDIRTTAGYVVGSGSQTLQGQYTLVADEPIADADGAIVERCRVRDEPSRDVPAGRMDTDADAAVVRAKDFLRLHPIAVEGQGGDHHTFRTVCRIRDFGVPEERAAECLEDWNARCVPPWEAADLAIKVANAYAYAQDPAGKLTPEALGFEVVPDQGPISPAPGPAPEVEAGELLHPSDIKHVDVLSAEYLIKGVLERQSNAVLFGQWNVGKTFVILDMAAAIATGQRWFGKRVKQGRVLYLGYEGIRAMKKRIIALREKHPLLKDAATPFRWAPLRNPLTIADGVAELGAILRSFVKKHGGAPDLIIIDPLANALGGDDADANLMGQLNRTVAELMRKQRCTVLRVHHSGHGNQDRARGHSSLPAGVDTEIRVTDQEIALTKQRDDVRAKVFFNLEIIKIGKDLDGDEVTTCVVVQIEDNAMDPALTGRQRELLDVLLAQRGDGGRVSKTDVRDAAPALDPAERRAIVAVLERKQYLLAEGDGWIIAERGPMAIFD